MKNFLSLKKVLRINYESHKAKKNFTYIYTCIHIYVSGKINIKY